MKKIAALVLLVVAAGACFAPLLDKPQGKAFHGELSDAEMTKLQGSGTSTGPANELQRTETDRESRSMIPNDSADAAKSLTSSSANNTGSAEATLSLTTSNSDVKGVESHGPNLFVGLFFVLIGVGVFFGLRTYLDKAAEDPFDKPKRTKPKF